MEEKKMIFLILRLR